MLQQFQNDLEKLIGKTTDLRPFVCEGSPLGCKIFIVGFNPATELKRSFWDFWQPNYGFQKTEWLKVYIQERRDRPLLPGKTRRNEISNTRRVIEWIVDEAMPVECLETNIYSKPTEQGSDLKERKRVSKPFDFLLRTIRPQAMLLHGQEAVRYIETRFKTKLKPDGVQHVKAAWGSVGMIAVSHLSRGCSKKRAQGFGRILRNKVQNQAMNYLQKEKRIREQFNLKYKTKAVKATLPIGNEGAKHEYDLFGKGRIIGGISISPWFNKTGSSNTGGQDRAAAELLWLSLWNGPEKRVHVLTDYEMARRLYERFRGVPLMAKIEIFHFDSNQSLFISIGTLG